MDNSSDEDYDQYEHYDPQKTLRRLAAHIDQPEKFAQTFEEAARTQKVIENSIKKIFNEMIKHDIDTIDRIKQLQREVDKEDWRSFIKKVGISGWTLFSLFMGGVLDSFLKKFLG